MIKKFLKFILIFVSIINLTGCYDYIDIDKRTIVTAVGVDKEEDNIKFTIEYPQIRSLSPAKTEGTSIQGKETVTISSTGKTFDEARQNYEKKYPFPIFLGATNIVILSRDFAKVDIIPYLNRINNIYDYRKTVLLVISREKAEDILKLKPKNDASIGFFINDLLMTLDKAGYTKYTTCGMLIEEMNSIYPSGYIPYIGIENSAPSYIGFAIIKKGKFVGYLNSKESNMANFLISKKPKTVIIINHKDNDKNILSLECSLKKRKINTEYVNGKPVININLNINAQLIYEYYVEPIDESYKSKLESEICEKLKEDIMGVILKSQNEFDSDFFDFYKYFKAQNKNIFKSLDWNEDYKKAAININIETKIERLGLIDMNAKKKY